MYTLEEAFGDTPENKRAKEEWRAVRDEINKFQQEAVGEACQKINSKYDLNITDLIPIQLKLKWTKEVLALLKGEMRD